MGWRIDETEFGDTDTVQLEIGAMFFCLSGGNMWERMSETAHQIVLRRNASNASWMRDYSQSLRIKVVSIDRCRHCGSQYPLTAYRIAKGNKGYCSPSCGAKHSRLRTVTVGGESLKLMDVIKNSGVSKVTYYRRLKRGASEEEALKKAKVYRVYELDGVKKTLSAWAKKIGVSQSKIRRMFGRGMSFRDIVNAAKNSRADVLAKEES